MGRLILFWGWLFAAGTVFAASFDCLHLVRSLRSEIRGVGESGSLNLSNMIPLKLDEAPGFQRGNATRLVQLDTLTQSNSRRVVPLVRMEGDRRPPKDLVNQTLGWTPGKDRIVLVLQEIDNRKPFRSSTSARIRHNLLIRSAIAVGVIRPKHFHVSIAHIDGDGNWVRANPTGVMKEVTKGDFLNQNVAYLPLEFSDAVAKRVGAEVRESIGQIAQLGCANASCAIASRGVNGNKSVPVLVSTNFREILRDGSLPVGGVYLSGTQVKSFSEVEKLLRDADWNIAAPVALLVFSLVW